MHSIKILLTIIFCIGVVANNVRAQATVFNIPLAGNSFLTSANHTTDSISEEGLTSWRDTASEFSIYINTETVCDIQMGVELSVPAGSSTIQCLINDKNYPLKITGSAMHTTWMDAVFQLQPGYTKIILRGLQKSNNQFALVKNLVIKSDKGSNTFHFVKENSGNRFYWGRRGPSLHLSYETPKDKNIEWFYSELTVPEGSDAIGSYFMANGFTEGYFGMQVNSAAERRILFSTWSPFETDDPAAIPDSDKIVLLKKGEAVHTGEFGDEGSGGQSYFIYPWQAGNTYRFLLHAVPDGKENTIYTAYYFAPEKNKWLLIASFKRPKTNTYLTRLHSFIENFIDTNGFLARSCHYGNQWAIDNTGAWYELTKANFIGDDIANVQYRMDYTGGSDKNIFFLQNGGFTNDHTPLKQDFTRTANTQHPDIDFSSLP
ncbi:DUF3472 domain-containing protein [soil metagenome]